MKHVILLCTAVIALLCIAGCTQIDQLGQPAITPTPIPAVTLALTTVPTSAITPKALVSDNTVVIQKMTYTPAQITVSVGAIVRWVNKDTVTHSVLFSPDAKIDTFALSPSQSYSVKFDRAGVYNYSCSIYPEMQGSVVVTS